MRKEKLRLMVKVCQLYYQSGYNQQEIAEMYGISRPKVSRLLSAARTEGIVEINVRNPFLNEAIMENKLKDLFDLKHAVVVDTTDVNEEIAHSSLGRAGSDFFESVIKDNDVIGIMAGDSVACLVREMNERNQPMTQIVPLVGGWSIQGMNVNANKIVTELASKTNGSYWVLHAPAIVSSVEVRKNLMVEPSVEKVIKLSTQANIALVGIGEISKEATFVKSMNLSNEELGEITDEGAVSSIGATFINESGEQVAHSFSRRMIGVVGNELKEIPLVVGVACGLDKIEAIIASLKGKWIDVLITDVTTADNILKSKNKQGMII